MYYISYDINLLNEIYQHFKILRFSTNPFTFYNPYIKSGNDVIDFIRYLKTLATNDRECYNMIYPWDEIDDDFIPNSEYIIIYNTRTNHIQGWCNIKYSKINDSKTKDFLYTCFIKEIVVRTRPKIGGIGTLIIDFIKNECFSKEIYFNDIGENFKILIDILYIYSLTSSIGFYKKIRYLTNLGDIYKEDELYKHVFIYLQDIHNITKLKRYRGFKESLKILHEFEVNSMMGEEEIRKYKEYRAPERCEGERENEHRYEDMLKSSKEEIKIESSKRRKILN